MAIKTRTEYIESLREQEPNVFVAGKRIDSVVDNPIFRTTINNMGLGYEWSNDEQYKDLATAWSPLINEEVSFWTHLRSTEEDLFQMINAIRTFSGKYLCTMCMSVGLSVLWATTYEIDQVRGTDYHLRLRAFFKNLQKNDLRFCLGVMDPKGDRRLSPSMQDDPDQFLRIVERRVAIGKKLTKTDEEILNSAEQKLNQEFALALNISPDEVVSYILKHVS
jgi:4-hydroxybutyryl-CoA dehydratase/vinylacetyl-CoA-Delta-isomerase